jgi:DNA-binding beta-propeller fold protein YncE
MQTHNLVVPTFVNICRSFCMWFVLLAALLPGRASGQLKLVQRIALPQDVDGHFDHFGVDLKHGRLFVTPEAAKCLEVFDIRTGKHIRTIDGIGEPHAVLYREDLNRIYVTDGEDGSLRIIDGDSYKIMKTVKLRLDADSVGYDPASRYLYIDNGGKDAKQDFVMISVVATDTGEIVAEMKVDGNSLEAITLETGSHRMFVNNRAKNTIEVVDREQRKIIGSWPITLGKVNVPMALDEADHRLFIGCRDGLMVVLDTTDGKELQALPITKGTDDLVFDSDKKRIYAAGDGAVDVYEQADPDHYKLLGTVPTGPVAKTARLVPELNRYFVAAPKHGDKRAEILVFDVE